METTTTDCDLLRHLLSKCLCQISIFYCLLLNGLLIHQKLIGKLSRYLAGWPSVLCPSALQPLSLLLLASVAARVPCSVNIHFPALAHFGEAGVLQRGGFHA